MPKTTQARLPLAPPSRAFSVLAALTTLAIVGQGALAGMFIDRDDQSGWITAHGVVADISWVLALTTALVGLRSVRQTRPAMWRLSAILFVLALAQTGVGHLITDKGMDGLIAVHVPLAMVIMGLTGWLTAWAIRARRTAVPVEPYGPLEARDRRRTAVRAE